MLPESKSQHVGMYVPTNESNRVCTWYRVIEYVSMTVLTSTVMYEEKGLYDRR